MRVAFYAPLKPPNHAVPSGDRRVGRLFMDALARAGHEVDLVSTLRTHEPKGDPGSQARIRAEGTAAAQDLIARWKGTSGSTIPELWFTYHVYYKAPDWLGPMVSDALGIPYVIAEVSYAPKRAGGPWSIGHEAAGQAIRAASLVLCATRGDVECVQPLLSPGAKVAWLPPFLDVVPYQVAARDRVAHRARFAARHGLDTSVPWVVVVAMMRAGDKAASYRMLATALARLTDLPWQAVVAGDGTERASIEAAFEREAPGRNRFLGELGPEEIAQLYASGDLCVWPAVNEAYGMAMLEAQAAGVPVVSRNVRGVPDVVRDGWTGLLALPGDEFELAACARDLLADPARRSAMGRAASQFVANERSLEATSSKLHKALEDLCRPGQRPGAAVRQ